MEKSVQITLIIVAGIVILGVLGYSFLNSMNPSPANTIDVQGIANVKAVPDLVTIYFTIEGTGNSTAEATQKVSEVLDKFKSNIIAVGVSEDKIVTQGFNVGPEYDWSSGKQKLRNYRASHSIKIEMPTSQTSTIGKLIDAGANAGANINYINFELSTEKQSEYKAEAMKLAAQDAKIKAESVASGVDKELGNLVSISVNEFNYYPWRVYDYAGGSAESNVEMAKQATTNINPGEEDISATVTVKYKLK